MSVGVSHRASAELWHDLVSACLEASANTSLRRSIAYSQSVVRGMRRAELRLRALVRSRTGVLT